MRDVFLDRDTLTLVLMLQSIYYDTLLLACSVCVYYVILYKNVHMVFALADTVIMTVLTLKLTFQFAMS